ncbi:MAG TPA: hypothetical protein VFO27_14580 [Bryobacteraceae bacterium]|nr:hypothetical protein [Bryobacteraceae bacterium]
MALTDRLRKALERRAERRKAAQDPNPLDTQQLVREKREKALFATIPDAWEKAWSSSPDIQGRLARSIKAADTPPATEQQQTVEKLAAERHQVVDQQIADFKASIEELAKQWQAEINQLLETGHATIEAASRLGQIEYLQGHVEQQLKQLGYEDLARSFTSQYEGAHAAAAEKLDALGIPVRRLTPIVENALAALQHLDFVRLIRTGQEAATAVTDGIIRNALGGMTRRQMIANIAGTLETRFQYLAVTYADTGLVSFDRTVEYNVYNVAGIDEFKYAGPKDIKTRKFCIAHVNKVYTRKQIDAMDNGVKQLPNVWLYGGGFCCRHSWLPWSPGSILRGDSLSH